MWVNHHNITKPYYIFSVSFTTGNIIFQILIRYYYTYYCVKSTWCIWVYLTVVKAVVIMVSAVLSRWLVKVELKCNLATILFHVHKACSTLTILTQSPFSNFLINFLHSVQPASPWGVRETGRDWVNERFSEGWIRWWEEDFGNCECKFCDSHAREFIFLWMFVGFCLLVWKVWGLLVAGGQWIDLGVVYGWCVCVCGVGGGYSVFHTVNVSVWNKKREGVTSNFKWSPYNWKREIEENKERTS